MLGLEPFDENRKAPFSISFDFKRNEKFRDCREVEEYFTVDPDAVREFVTAASPALDAMAEVVQKADYYAFPVIPDTIDDFIGALILDRDTIRGILTAFRFRAWLREKEGDLEGADADRLTLLKFGRQMQKEATSFIPLIMGKGVEKEGAGMKDPEKWKMLEPIDRQENLRRVLELEGICSPSIIQNHLRMGRTKGFSSLAEAGVMPDEWFDWFAMHLGFDWNIVAKRSIETQKKGFFPEKNPFSMPVRALWWDYLHALFSRRARSEFLGEYLGRCTSVDLSLSQPFLLEEVSPPAP